MLENEVKWLVDEMHAQVVRVPQCDMGLEEAVMGNGHQ